MSWDLNQPSIFRHSWKNSQSGYTELKDLCLVLRVY